MLCLRGLVLVCVFLSFDAISESGSGGFIKPENIQSIDEDILLLENRLENMTIGLIDAEEKFATSQRDWTKAKHNVDENDKLSIQKRNFAELKFNKNKSLYERKLSRIAKIRGQLDELKLLRDTTIAQAVSTVSRAPVAKRTQVSPPAPTSVKKQVSPPTSTVKKKTVSNVEPSRVPEKSSPKGVQKLAKVETPVPIKKNELQKVASVAGKSSKNSKDNVAQEIVETDGLKDVKRIEEPDNEKNKKKRLDTWPNQADLTQGAIDFAKGEIKRLKSKKEEPLLGKVTLKSKGKSTKKMSYLSEGVYTTTMELDSGVNELKILNKTFIVDSSLYQLKGSEPIYRVVFDVASLASPKLYVFEEALLN